jgi:RimJ/RimL family protein N-acetyltransferase
MITSEHFIAVKENLVSETKPFSLQTPRLLLKGLTVAEAKALFEYRSLPEITHFQGWAPTSVEEAVRFVEAEISHVMDQPDTWFQMGIFLADQQILIGDLGLHFIAGELDSSSADSTENANTIVEIGITLAPAFQGRGFAAEAIRHVLAFLFGTLHKSRIIASVDPKNLSSMALMSKLGFQLEEVTRNSVLIRGEWTDDAVFAMTYKQWRNQPNPTL